MSVLFRPRATVAEDVGNKPFGYTTSLVATIGLWLAIAPAAAAVAGTRHRKGR